MSIKSYPFAAQNIGTEDTPQWDRSMSSADLRSLFGMWTDGRINANDCKVTVVSNTSIQISTGKIIVGGVVVEIYDSPQTLSIRAADNTRHDRVVVEVDMLSRTANIKIVEDAGSTPLIYTPSKMQFEIAQLEVSPGKAPIAYNGTTVSMPKNMAAAVSSLTPEYGSASGRGEYLKFPSGLLICWRALIVNVPSSAFTTTLGTNRYLIEYNANNTLKDLNWAYPEPFYAMPTVSAGAWSSYNFTQVIRQVTKDDAVFKLIYEGSKPSGEPAPVLNTIAIGKWKDQITM